MFDSLPTSFDTIEDFMTELARVANRPLVGDILLANVKRPERHRKFLPSLLGPKPFSCQGSRCLLTHSLVDGGRYGCPPTLRGYPL
jgi:hypothetical protein